MLKTIAFLSSIIFLAACGNAVNIERQFEYLGFDFTKYSEKNFFITTETYNKDYKSLGLVTVKIFPSIRKAKTSEKPPEGYFGVYIEGNYHFVEDLTGEMLIEPLFQKAKELGADAIIKFDYGLADETFKFPSPQSYNKDEWIKVYYVSGLAIKRLNE